MLKVQNRYQKICGYNELTQSSSHKPYGKSKAVNLLHRSISFSEISFWVLLI